MLEDRLKFSDDPKAKFYMGLAKFKAGKYSDAEEYLTDLVDRDWVQLQRKQELEKIYARNYDEKFIPAVRINGSEIYTVFASIRDVISAWDSSAIESLTEYQDNISPVELLPDGLYFNIDEHPAMVKCLQKESGGDEKSKTRTSQTYNLLGLCQMEKLDRIGWNNDSLTFKRATMQFGRALTYDEDNVEARINLAYMKLYEAREKEIGLQSTIRNLDGGPLAELIKEEFKEEISKTHATIWRDGFNSKRLLIHALNRLDDQYESIQLAKDIIERDIDYERYSLNEKQLKAIKHRLYQQFYSIFPGKSISFWDLKKAVMQEYASDKGCFTDDYSALTKKVKKALFLSQRDKLYSLSKDTFERILKKEIETKLEKKTGRNDVYIVNPKNAKSRVVLKVYKMDDVDRARNEEKYMTRLRLLGEDLELPYGKIVVPECWLLQYQKDKSRKEGYVLLAVQRVNEDSLAEKFSKGEMNEEEKLKSIELALDATAVIQCTLSEEFHPKKISDEERKKAYTKRFLEKFIQQHQQYGGVVLSEDAQSNLENLVEEEFSSKLAGFYHMRYIDGNLKNQIEKVIKGKSSKEHHLYPVDFEIDRWQVAAKDPISIIEFDDTNLDSTDIKYLYSRWFFNLMHYFVYRRGEIFEQSIIREKTISKVNLVRKKKNEGLLGSDDISKFFVNLKRKLTVREKLNEFDKDYKQIMSQNFEIENEEQRKMYLQRFRFIMKKYDFDQIEDVFYKQMNAVSAKFHLFITGDKLRDQRSLENEIKKLESTEAVQKVMKRAKIVKKWKEKYKAMIQKSKENLRMIWAEEGFIEQGNEFADTLEKGDLEDKFLELFPQDFPYYESSIERCMEKSRKVSYRLRRLEKAIDENQKKIKFDVDAQEYNNLRNERKRAKKNYRKHMIAAMEKMREANMKKTLETIVDLFELEKVLPNAA